MYWNVYSLRLRFIPQESCFVIFWVPYEPCRVECRASPPPWPCRAWLCATSERSAAEPVGWELTPEKEFSPLLLSAVVLFVSSSRGCLVDLALCHVLTPLPSCLSCQTLWSVSGFLTLSLLCLSPPGVLAILTFLWHHWVEPPTLDPLSRFYFHPIHFTFPCAWVEGSGMLVLSQVKRLEF